MSRLGDLIRLERTRQGLTHKQVARKCGVSDKYLMEVEAGTRIIADDQARRILKSMGMTEHTEADFTLDDAVTLETVAEWAERGEAAALLRPVESCFAHLPRADIDGEAERRCRNGNPFLWEGEAGDWRVFGADGGFLMLGQSDGNGQMTSIRNFF